MKNTLEGINSKGGDTEKCIKELENLIEVTQSEHQKEDIYKNKYIVQIVWTSGIQTFLF